MKRQSLKRTVLAAIAVFVIAVIVKAGVRQVLKTDFWSTLKDESPYVYGNPDPDEPNLEVIEERLESLIGCLAILQIWCDEGLTQWCDERDLVKNAMLDYGRYLNPDLTEHQLDIVMDDITMPCVARVIKSNIDTVMASIPSILCYVNMLRSAAHPVRDFREPTEGEVLREVNKISSYGLYYDDVEALLFRWASQY